MFGLMVLLGLGLYIAGCFFLVRLVVRNSKNKRWLKGAIVFLIYNAPLGYQVVPALVVGQYLCYTESGFWLYKTPEQWRAENPGVAETLSAIEGGKSKTILHKDTKFSGIFERTDIYYLNERINRVNEYHYILTNLVQETLTLVDTKDESVLAKKINYKMEALPFLGQGLGNGCYDEGRDRWRVNGSGFNRYKKQFQLIGEK